jgi:hypothetical protein
MTAVFARRLARRLLRQAFCDWSWWNDHATGIKQLWVGIASSMKRRSKPTIIAPPLPEKKTLLGFAEDAIAKWDIKFILGSAISAAIFPPLIVFLIGLLWHIAHDVIIAVYTLTKGLLGTARELADYVTDNACSAAMWLAEKVPTLIGSAWYFIFSIPGGVWWFIYSAIEIAWTCLAGLERCLFRPSRT